jgi:hypothetical protein
VALRAEALGHAGALDRTPEYRQRPMIPLARSMRVLLMMALAQLGSLRAMRTTSSASRWRAALLGTMPRDDTRGRGLDGVGPLPLRRTPARTVARLLGMKALRPRHGVWAIILDGHESHVSPKRHCPGCLMRRVQTRTGERREYYHRHVMAMLPAEPDCVVLTDALYARADFVTVVRQQHLHLWCIENHGFNELATYWHADHVYRHTPRAIAAAILLILPAYLVFHLFYWHNLRPDLRATATKLDIARQPRAHLYYLPGDDQPDTS